MFRRLTLLVLAITIFSGPSRGSRIDLVRAGPGVAEERDSQPSSVSDAETRALTVNAPRPAYPLEARRNRITGSGVASLEVDKRTGYVTSARMLKSTGHQILDDAALKAFRQWRFKAGIMSPARIPVQFVLLVGPGWRSRNMYGFDPEYPREARDKGLTGSGVVLVHVNPGTGNLISARMLKSTGQKILDGAALDAVRNWRFKAGTASSLRIPITFTKTGIRY